MALELDTRQRAMLAEMGVRVWAPQAEAAQDLQPVAVAPARALAPTETKQQELPVVKATRTDTADWSGLLQAVQDCRACALHAGRKQVTLAPAQVAQADWLIVGDPPDEYEDRAATPFSETSVSTLLDNMLKAMGLIRNGGGKSGVYVTNVVKCRPPHGRVVQAQEWTACAGFLDREIALVQPKIILAMGRIAVQALLSSTTQAASLPLGKQRGQVYQYGGLPVVVTYHPAVLLRAGADKAKAWADLCLALDVATGCLQSEHAIS